MVQLAVGTTLAAAALLLARPLHAQAFGLNEIGTCSVARTGAGVASPCDDGSAIFWNPAAAVRLEDRTLYVGAAGVAVSGDFTQDFTGRVHEGDTPVEVPPHLFATYRPVPRLAAGIGVYVPYGLTSEWEDDFPGRFAARHASLASIYIQPSIAWDVVPGRLSIGGGPVVGISTVELEQSLDLSEQATPTGATFAQLGIARRTEFARAELHGRAIGWGYNVGVQWTPNDAVQFGVRYLSEIRFDYDDGEIRFEQVPTGLVIPSDIPDPANPGGDPLIPAGTPVDAILAPQFAGPQAPLRTQRARTRIDHPAQLAVGVAISPNRGRTRFLLDYGHLFWSSFDELPLRVEGPNQFLTPSPLDRELIEDYDDTWTVKGAVDHRFDGGWEGRLGASFIRTPAPDETVTPLLPDMDRWNFGAGLGVPLGNRWLLDLAYLRVETEGRRGRLAERQSLSQTAEELNEGFYRLNANVFSASIRLRF